MGNQKFKLFDIIPNSWVYKLKDINNTTNKPSKPQSPKLSKNHHSSPPLPPPPQPSTTNEPPQYQPRKSYHITRELTNNPRKELNFPPFSPPRRSKYSSKSRKSSRRTNSMSSCSCQSNTTFQSYPSKSDSPSSPHVFQEYDVILHVETGQLTRDRNTIDFKLPSIITKQETKPRNYSKEEKKISSSPKRCQEKGMKLKVNSPRIMGRKQGQNGNSGRRSTSSKKRSISESFAVVKSSFDPQKDFKESMMEMIVQNNLRGGKDLEDLLACYLSLNSNEYHDVIINVFKQIWFDLRENKKKI